MKFKTTTVKGYGRGKTLGFPTVTMEVPSNIPLTLEPGAYAARATIGGETYDGALYYGPNPTFDEKGSTLEIHLFDTSGFYSEAGEDIEIEIVKFIRPVISFDLPELLVIQIGKDVEKIREVLKKEG